MIVTMPVAACVQRATVTIDQTGGRVIATVARGETRACVDDLDVIELREGSGEPVSGAWHISTADVDLCFSRFKRGEVPEGFAQDATLLPLVRGRRYRVEVSGTGFVGAGSFTAAAGVPSSGQTPMPNPVFR